MEASDEHFGDRLVALMDELKIKPGVFAIRLGMKPQTLSSFTGARRSEPTLKTLRKIGLAFPRVNMDWLVYGRGEALRPLGDSNTNYMVGNTGNTVGVNNGGSLSQNINSPEDLRALLAACQARNKELEAVVADKQMIIELLQKSK